MEISESTWYLDIKCTSLNHQMRGSDWGIISNLERCKSTGLSKGGRSPISSDSCISRGEPDSITLMHDRLGVEYVSSGTHKSVWVITDTLVELSGMR